MALTKSKHAATALAVIESSDERCFAATEVATADIHLRAFHPLESSDVDDTGEREIPEQRAGGTFHHVHVPNRRRKNQAPVVVAFGVSVDGLVDRNTVDP